MRSLPVADPSQLYRIGDTDDCCVNGGFVGESGDFDIFSYDLYGHLKDSAPEFQSLAAVHAGHSVWSVRRGNELPRELYVEFVTGNYFSTLGVNSYEGRVLGEGGDDQAEFDAGGGAQLCLVAKRIRRRPASIIGQTVLDSDALPLRSWALPRRSFSGTGFQTGRRISGCQ